MYTASFGIFVAALALCSGAPSKELSWRVVGGTDADEGAEPHQIVLLNGGSFSCSGSILNPRTVITAAHCAQAKPEQLTIRVGSNQLSSGGQVVAVSEVFVHEEYDPWAISNDVAILILAQDLVFTDKIKAISLDEVVVGGNEDSKLTGWGRTNYPGDVSEKLQTLNLKTITHENCQALWGTLPKSQLCTFTKSGEGACHGDSGGPLTKDGKLIGIVSWGSPCAVGYPDVFSRVSSFIGWINLHMRQ